MLKFILRRCLEAIPTLFILITISFFMMRLAPGSPFTGERNLPPEVMANIEAKYHLNDPLLQQYGQYLLQLSKGDFGPSFKYKDYSVNDLVYAAFPVSAKLGLAAFIVAVLLGITAGALAALYQNSKWDYTLMGFAMTGVVLANAITSYFQHLILKTRRLYLVRYCVLLAAHRSIYHHHDQQDSVLSDFSSHTLRSSKSK